MVVLELPFPPSVNHYYRRVGGATLISREGRRCRMEATARLAASSATEGKRMSDSKNSRSSAALSSGTPGADENWSEIEQQFRVWSFRLYYEKCFASELDNTLRFAKALIASCRPIRNRELVYAWHRDRACRARRGRTRHGADNGYRE